MTLSSIFGDSSSRMLQRMGYSRDQEGIIRRYRREPKWNAHLQQTQAFAEAAAVGGRSAIVLGSGWLLDVPINTLCERYERVVLVDLRHPKLIKDTTKTLNNIELRTFDISGFAEPVYRYVQRYRYKRKRPPLESIEPASLPCLSQLTDELAFDFVFSCNILSQLDILLVDYLTQFFDIDESERSAFRKKVQQAHIDLLPSGACLVTDVEEIAVAADGHELSRRPTVEHPIINRSDAQRWRWKFDSHQSYHSGQNTELEVVALCV